MTDERVLELEALSQSLQFVENSLREIAVLLAEKAPGLTAAVGHDPAREERSRIKAELQTLRHAGRDLIMQIDRLVPDDG